MKNLFSLKFFIITLIIVLAVLTRFLPTPPNFAPIAAIALFGGTFFADRRLAFLIPLLAMLLSDIFLGLHSTLLFVYGAFALIVLIGMKLGKNLNPLRLTGAALAGSTLFFIITNFGVWLISAYYPLTPAGLIACYTAAIPFFHYTILGDLFYTAVIFGSYELARRSVPALQQTA